MKNILLISTFSVLSLVSCQKNDQDQTVSKHTANINTADQQDSPEVITDTGYNISKIPVTDRFYGTFPYFQLPEGYTYTDPNSYQGDGQIKDFDKEYFYDRGTYTPVEGKTFKAEIRISEEFKDKKFSPLEIQKSFDELINNLGGVKINTGQPVREDEEERLKKNDPEAYNLGYLHSYNNWKNVNTYIIRTAQKTVFVQYSLGKDQVSITVLEARPFENKMTIREEKVTAKNRNADKN